MMKDWKKYVFTFVITAAIFGTAIAVSSRINSSRVGEIRTMQDSISLNILSSETQFNLLKDADCNDLFNSDIAKQLTDMGERLSYMETTGHVADDDVINLKQYYYLLEIKDYLLTNSGTKCPLRPTTVLYFYKPDCPECDRQNYVLSYLSQHYPENIRVYSFDYSINIPVVRTLANINKVEEPMPVIIINGKAHQGFQSIEDIHKIDPRISEPHVRIVLSPHLDDAVLSVGGLLAKSNHSDDTSIIATVFSGTPSTATTTDWDTKSGFKDSTQAMVDRISENVDGAKILGSSVINLGYLDNQYRKSTATSSLENQIAADIMKIIRDRDTGTSNIEIYGPAVFDGSFGHVDHTIVHNAFMKVIAQYKTQNTISYFIYEDFPYAKSAGIPQQSIIGALKANSPQYNYSPIYVPLTESLISTKEDSIAAYNSQTKAMNNEGLDVISSDLSWMKNRCIGLLRISSSCETVYQVQK